MLRAVRCRSGSFLVLPLVLTGMSVAVSGCHNALSSQGTPHSNYQAAKQATQPGQPAPAKPSKPQPPTTPVTPTKPVPPTTPTTPTEDLTQESMTLLSANDVQNKDVGKPISNDSHLTLQLTFLDNYKLENGVLQHDEVDDSDTYLVYLQDGKSISEKVAQENKKNNIGSCVVEFTITETHTDNDLLIDKGQVYTFTREIGPKEKDKDKDNEGNRHAVLTNTTAPTTPGGIVSISCFALIKDSIGPSVNDLVLGLGGPAVVQATVKTPPGSAFKPAAQPAPSQTTQSIQSASHAVSSMSRRPQSVTSDSNDGSQVSAQLSGKSTVKKSLLVEHDESMIAARPNFAFQLEGSMNAFGGSTISPAQQGVTSKAALIEAEYQPTFLQGLGVIGIGPSIGMYPTTGGVVGTGQQVVNGPTSIWELGGQVRYQFRYVTEQMIVPFIGYNYQRLHYNINQGGGNSGLSIAGGNAGLSVLLNRLDETAALDLYRNTGISRLYLVAELKNLQGSDDNVAIAGNSFFFGIRCEL
jgi:hypothetical protein